MDNPHAANQPDHYSERYIGNEDNGGVHINSGIANKAFFLLAKGGTHHLGGSMTGIGADAAARIWYTALSNYMTPGTNFSQARVATLNAATALYGLGSTQYQAVNRSWALCGVS
jgi:Zn-dependent metalloprotease